MQITIGKKNKKTIEVLNFDHLLELVRQEKIISFTKNGSIYKIEALYVSSLTKRP